MRPVGLACVLTGVLLGPQLPIFLPTHQKIVSSYTMPTTVMYKPFKFFAISGLRECYLN